MSKPMSKWASPNRAMRWRGTISITYLYHYLYEAANVLLTTVKKRFALRGWGLRRMRRLGPKGRAWR